MNPPNPFDFRGKRYLSDVFNWETKRKVAQMQNDGMQAHEIEALFFKALDEEGVAPQIRRAAADQLENIALKNINTLLNHLVIEGGLPDISRDPDGAVRKTYILAAQSAAVDAVNIYRIKDQKTSPLLREFALGVSTLTEAERGSAPVMDALVAAYEKTMAPLSLPPSKAPASKIKRFRI